MRYAPEQDMVPAVGRPLRPRVRRAVIDALDQPGGPGSDLMGPAGPKSGNSGIAGTASAAIEPAPAPAAPKPAGPGAFASQMSGFDTAKFSDLSHNTPKYQLARAMSNFDPRQGITPEVLAALNGLGLGTFEGLDEDEVRLRDGHADFGGISEFDLIEGFDGGNGKWAYQGLNGPAAQPQPQQGAQPGNAMRGMDPEMTSIIDQIRKSILSLMGNQ